MKSFPSFLELLSFVFLNSARPVSVGIQVAHVGYDDDYDDGVEDDYSARPPPPSRPEVVNRNGMRPT